MATVIDPATAIQKKVDVSIKDGKTFNGRVFLLEIWSMGNVTSEKTLEVEGEKTISGTFKQMQFRFDTKNNYIYTKSDVNQKEFDKTYKGTASVFYISGLADNANTIIRMASTNDANDLSEPHNGPAERIEVRVSGEPDKPTKPTEGIEKSGANKDPTTWIPVNMKDDPAKWKVVDDANKNVATDFTKKEIAQQYIDYYKSVNVEQVKCPPGQIWDAGQGKCVEAPHSSDNIELLSGIDFDEGKYSKHNTGPRIQHGARLDILNRESEAYFKLLKGQKSDELSWGVRGGPHSDGKDVREYKFYMPISGHDKVFAKEYGKDIDKKYDKVEANEVEAKKKGFSLLDIRKESQSGKMGIEITVDPEKEFGMKVRHYNLDKNGDGKPDAVKLEAFVDFKDGNGWQKYIDGEDDGTKLNGPGPLIKFYKNDERDHIRVDNCGECSDSNHSIYIPGTYKVGLIKGGLGEDDKYWPWENVDDNWEKKDGDR